MSGGQFIIRIVRGRLQPACSGSVISARFKLPAYEPVPCDMSLIDIHAHHRLSREDALSAANDLSRDLARKFDIDYAWEGEVIHFERPGVHGQIWVTDGELRIKAHLGFLLAMLKGPIEREIIRYLSDEFGCSF